MTKSFLFLMFLTFSPVTFSCSCSIGDVEEKFDEHVSVFMGTVKKITFYDSNDAFGDQRIKVEFELEKQWKGEPSQNVLFTVFNSVSCYGYWFKENQRYVVYAFNEDQSLNAWWCGGVISEADSKEQFMEELDVLNEITR